MPLPLLPVIGYGATFVGGGAMAAWIGDWFRKDIDKLPVGTIRKYLNNIYGKNVYTEQQIKDYWAVYILGVVDKKNKPFDYRDNPTPTKPSQQPIVDFMVQKIPGASVGKIRNFAFALQYLASQGKIPIKFWSPEQSREAEIAVKEYRETQRKARGEPKEGRSNFADLADAAKYGAISVIGLVGVWAIIQLAPMIRRK